MSERTLTRLSSLPQIDTVLCIGTGNGDNLPTLLATDVRRIVLVEPNPAMQHALAVAEVDERVLVLPLAVAPNAGQAQLRQFSFAAMSSLHSPSSALIELFPQLRETGMVPVETLPLPGIIERAGIDLTASNVLVVDAPGTEGQIIDELLCLPAANRFEHVFLRAGAVALYEGGRGFEDLGIALENEGYRREFHAIQDPDFPEGHWYRDPLTIRISQLNRELDDATTARTAAEERLAALEEQVSSQAQARAKADADALRGEHDTLRARIAELETAAKEAEGAREKEAGARHAAESHAAKAKADADALRGEHDTLRARIAELETSLKEANMLQKTTAAAHAAAEERVGDLLAEMSQIQTRHRHLETEIVRAEAQIDFIRALCRLPEAGTCYRER